MEFVTDLHLHSKYSRAVSPQMVLPEMAKWAAKKGINLLTSGDFTHPLWFRNIKAELEEAGEGGDKLKIKNEKLKINKENVKLFHCFIVFKKITPTIIGKNIIDVNLVAIMAAKIKPRTTVFFSEGNFK